MQSAAPRKAPFKPSSYRTIIECSARELDVRNTSWMVLKELLAVMSYANGSARISTPRLCERVGRSERAVKTALQELRDKGLIYWLGRAGRGKTALYGFRYTRAAVQTFNQECEQSEKKRGAIFTPLCVGEYHEKEGKFFHKGVQIFPQRGANFAPPSPLVSIYQQEDEAPAGRGAVPDDAKGVCTVDPWDGTEPYSNYLGRVAASEREALRAAMNE